MLISQLIKTLEFTQELSAVNEKKEAKQIIAHAIDLLTFKTQPHESKPASIGLRILLAVHSDLSNLIEWANTNKVELESKKTELKSVKTWHNELNPNSISGINFFKELQKALQVEHILQSIDPKKTTTPALPPTPTAKHGLVTLFDRGRPIQANAIKPEEEKPTSGFVRFLGKLCG